MYSVSEITKKIGVARSTLLYYERIKLLKPSRDPDNGYRIYSKEDLNRLVLLKQLQKTGLTLLECAQFLEGTPDMELVEERLALLDRELLEMRMAKNLLKSIYFRFTGKNPPEVEETDHRKWHSDFEKRAADAHFNWLQEIGFSAKESLYIRWVSRDMANNETYMRHFFTIFENMKRQGPGSIESTSKAFNSIKDQKAIKHILEIGCGTGAASLALLEETDSVITAVDNHKPFLDRFQKEIDQKGYSQRVLLHNMDMHDLDFPDGSFDMLWAEGSAYIMGFESALFEWKRLLRDRGYLFVSDAVWLSETPSKDCLKYWSIEYPNMVDIETRESQAVKCGYEIINSFVLPRKDWKNFYRDMKELVTKALERSGANPTYEDMLKEISVDENYGNEYGYICLMLRKK